MDNDNEKFRDILTMSREEARARGLKMAYWAENSDKTQESDSQDTHTPSQESHPSN
jgi:hypothetical protein